jgi:hypothetical protein
VYANSIAGKFVFDDIVIIKGNESIRGLSPGHLTGIFGGHYWKAVEDRGGLYRPVVMVSYALNYAWGGEDPRGYHLVNILLHAANDALVFALLQSLFRMTSLAFLTSILFVLHPIRTEGVASLVGRAECLSTFFVLAAWMAYGKAARSARRRWLLLSAGCFCLAVLTKESAFSFLALLPLTDYVTRRGTLKEIFALPRAIVFYGPFVAAACLVLAIRYAVLGGFVPLYINPGSNPIANADPWPRFLTATHVFARYLGLLVFPVNLSADYSFNQIPLVTGLLSWKGFVPVLLLLILLTAVAASFRRHPILFFCLFVFFSSFALTSNWILPIGTMMAERLMYFPALGFNAALALLAVEGLSRVRWREIAAVACAVVIAGYAVRTVTRNMDWRDHYALFSSAARVSPNSFLVQSNLAAVLLREKRNPAAAIEHAKLAIRILPDAPAAHYTLGEASRRVGDLDGALAAFAEVVRLAPRTSGAVAALRQIAEMRSLQGKWPEARSAYEKLIEWRRGVASARRALERVGKKR